MYRTKAGEWSCNAVSQKVTTRMWGGILETHKHKWGCVFSTQLNKNCSHIQACKIMIDKIKNERFEEHGDEFIQDLSELPRTDERSE